MRITLWCRSFLAGVLVSTVLAASAITFGAGVANAEHGRIGPWPGDGYGFGPYIVAPEPTNASPASSDDATWPPTGPSWPPGGSGGDSGGSATPIVMPHNQPSTTPAATAE
jgi:hypothetical protein